MRISMNNDSNIGSNLLVTDNLMLVIVMQASLQKEKETFLLRQPPGIGSYPKPHSSQCSPTNPSLQVQAPFYENNTEIILICNIDVGTFCSFIKVSQKLYKQRKNKQG